MKSIKKILLSFIIIFSVSCGNDDSSETQDASIVGTWNLISDISEGVELVEEGDCDTLYIFTLNTISIEEYDGADCTEVDLTDNTWEYTLENNVIIGFDEDEITGEDVNVQITQLTNTLLKLEFENGDILTMERQ